MLAQPQFSNLSVDSTIGKVLDSHLFLMDFLHFENNAVPLTYTPCAESQKRK